jgi:(p)ppGpp synthase/HD superfamily hydrolase
MTSAVFDLARALDFVARKHAGQRRKGTAAEPYINHLAEVAWLLAEATAGEDRALVMAGLLHDTLEDTDTTLEELTHEFGSEIAALVAEVSDDKSLDRETRKRLQAATAAQKSPRAKMIKLADKISNIRSIIESPPRDWSVDRKLRYVEWAREVVAGCRGVNGRLEAEFDAACRAASLRLEGDAGGGR